MVLVIDGVLAHRSDTLWTIDICCDADGGMMHDTNWLTWGVIGLLAWMLMGAAWYLYRTDPKPSKVFPPCMFHQLTGWHCPGCGGTRAVHAILNGQWTVAIRLNPMLIVGGPIILGLIVYQYIMYRRDKMVLPYLGYAIAVMFTASTLIRNFPSPTNGWLAP